VKLELPDELLEAIAARPAELVAERPAASPWMTRRAAAEYLGVPTSRLEKDRTVPCRRWDGRVLYHRDELDAWLERFRDGDVNANVNGARPGRV
jgi:hypothetical protein